MPWSQLKIVVGKDVHPSREKHGRDSRMNGKKDDPFGTIEILENAIVIYTDGNREIFEAIRMTDRGVIIGRVLDDEFVDCGFISKGNIKEIRDGVKKQIPMMKS